ncbi:serpin B3 [Vanessa atalanta]|uniref:serpin B3 n=1 Tax=Vanessa atalanta TaxID=42275 RepID=UPI001FCD00B2|nr:serpin B3 [Vanessa atalanta]
MKPLYLVLLVAVGLTSARWVRRQRSNQKSEVTSFVGEATNELSTTILQSYIDDDKNIAFSPLGYSTILAILAEGARGDTRNQLISALHLPEDQNLTRKTYRYIMDRLKYRNEYKYNQPELKNFFYVYKNYTINDDYKKILEDYYLTEVRSVERYNSLEPKDDGAEKNVNNEEIPDIIPPKESDEKLITYAVEDIPEKVDISHMQYKPAKNIKEQIKLVKTSEDSKEFGDEEETMVAVEARNHARSLRVLNEKHDIASSISVNSVGKKSSKTSNSLMLIFNGMYFRGSWKKPFTKVEPGVFYKSNTEKKQVPMMKAHGTFKTSSLPDLDSEAIFLPYDGGRYALMLLVPRTRDGLTRLIADLPATSLPDIQENLKEEELQVSLPTFYVETTTKPLTALAKFGVSSIFGREADLTGISSKEGLFVQELVQNVAVRVDNTDSSATMIGASNADEEADELASLKNLPLTEIKEPRKFCVEHPFVFYIVDRLDNLVVVAGKVTDPQSPSDFSL